MTRHRPLGSALDQPASATADPAGPNAEARMRRALGLGGGPIQPRTVLPRPADAGTQGRHRHRFVSDGEVPVVMVNSRSDQPGGTRPEATAALQGEKDARERAERALAGAQASIRDLQGKLSHAQTTLAHVTLARDEAVAALQQMQEQAAAARAVPATAAEETQETPPAARRRGRPPKSPSEKPVAKPRVKSQKPVKWWIKGWRSALAD